MANKCPICKENVLITQSGNQDYRTDFIPTHLACFAKAWDNQKPMIINDPPEEEPIPEDDDGIEDPAIVGV